LFEQNYDGRKPPGAFKGDDAGWLRANLPRPGSAAGNISKLFLSDELAFSTAKNISKHAEIYIH
jgi:hypothetical protein